MTVEVLRENASRKEKIGNTQYRRFTAWIESHKTIFKKIYTPPKEVWWKEYRHVIGGVLLLSILLLAADWLFVQSISFLQGWLAGPGLPGIASGIYLTLLILSGILTVSGIFLQRGSADGLTSLFGSTLEYGGSSTAGITQKVSTYTLILGSFFTLFILLSPLVLR